jgi:hypothetical protein
MFEVMAELEHQAVLDALRHSDGERAVTAIRAHVMVHGERFNDLLVSLSRIEAERNAPNLRRECWRTRPALEPTRPRNGWEIALYACLDLASRWISASRDQRSPPISASGPARYARSNR